MKQLVQFCLSVVVGTTFLIAAAQPARAEDEAISSARRLPSNVYAYLSIRNTTELKQKFNASLSGQLLNHPDLATVRENILEVIQNKSQDVEEKLGATLSELLSVPQGEIALAIVQPPGKPMAPVAMIDFGDKGEIVNKVLTTVADGLQDRGIERSTEEYEDNEIVMLKQGHADGEPRATGFDLAYCIKDKHLVVGKGSDVVKAVLARWDGEHDSTLMSNDVFRYLVKKCSGEDTASPPLITWYLDPIGLIQVVAASGPPQIGMVVGMLPLTGLNNLKAAGGTMAIGEGEFDSVSRTMFYLEQPTTGLLNVFNFPADAQSPPAWVPKNATSFFAINWGIDKAYRSVETLVDTFKGPGALAMALDDLSESQFNGDVHLKDDVLDVLTGKIRVIGDMPDADAPEKTRSLFAMEVKNSDDAKAILAKVAGMEGFPGETREFRGKTIYEFTVPAAVAARLNPGQAADAEDQIIGVAIVKDHFMVGMDVTILEQVILSDADAGKLSDSKAYQQIAKFFPAETSAVTFTKSDSEVKSVYELLRSGNAEFLMGNALEGIDFSQLPDFKTISQFLPPRGSYLVPDERGYFLKSFSPKKAETP